jgi:hypothetical protein
LARDTKFKNPIKKNCIIAITGFLTPRGGEKSPYISAKVNLSYARMRNKYISQIFAEWDV